MSRYVLRATPVFLDRTVKRMRKGREKYPGRGKCSGSQARCQVWGIRNKDLERA
jgi:hypothetical protein